MSYAEDLIYRWTPERAAASALRRNRLYARRWEHWIEKEGRFVRGSSWSRQFYRWQHPDLPVCLMARRDLIPNRIYSISGQRVYWQTLAKKVAEADPLAYLQAPTEPDEEFVEGPVANLAGVLHRLLLPEAMGGELLELAATRGVEVVRYRNEAETGRKRFVL